MKKLGERNPSRINYFLRATKSYGLKNSVKLEQTLHRRQINIHCPTIQKQLYETAKVKLVIIYRHFMKLRKKRNDVNMVSLDSLLSFQIVSSLYGQRKTLGITDLKPCSLCRKSALEILTSQDSLINLIPIFFSHDFKISIPFQCVTPPTKCLYILKASIILKYQPPQI